MGLTCRTFHGQTSAEDCEAILEEVNRDADHPTDDPTDPPSRILVCSPFAGIGLNFGRLIRRHQLGECGPTNT